MIIGRDDYGRTQYQWGPLPSGPITGGMRRGGLRVRPSRGSRRASYSGCGSCGGGGFGWSLTEFLRAPADALTGWFGCPSGTLWDSEKRECTPYTVRTNGETRPGRPTETPEPISYATKWYATGGEPAEYKSPFQPIYDFFQGKGPGGEPGQGIDWMTVLLVGAVGLLIVKKL